MTTIPDNIFKLWFQSNRQKDSDIHVIGFHLMIYGQIDIKWLREAYINTIKSHSVYGLNYFLNNGKLDLKFQKEVNFCWVYKDISSSNIEVEILRELYLKESSNIISLENQIYNSAFLYRVSSDEHMLSIAMHHLYCDGQSLRVFANNLMSEWRNIVGERFDEINSPPNYLDFIFGRGNININIYGTNHSSPLQPQEVIPDTQINTDKISFVSESSIKLKDELVNKLCEVCKKKGISFFNLITACWGVLFGGHSNSKSFKVGILVSNRPRVYFNTIGYFTQALSLDISQGEFKTIIELAKQIKNDCKLLTSRLKSGINPDISNTFNTMISMVKYSDTHLLPPSGVSVNYLRRLHLAPEKNEHVYIYQYKSRLEVVLNYQTTKLTSNQAKDKLSKLKSILHWVANDEYDLNNLMKNQNTDLKMLNDNEILFHHIGYAVWESDLGISRMISNGASIIMNKTIDQAMNVELTMLRTIDGVNLELIAPLSEKAPCVGHLNREGEGPYHLCWEVNNIKKVITLLDKNSLEYNMVLSNGNSELLKDKSINFLHIKGFGLIEFIEPQQDIGLSVNNYNPKVTLSIKSNYFSNAVKFLSLLGFSSNQESDKHQILKLHNIIIKLSESISKNSQMLILAN